VKRKTEEKAEVPPEKAEVASSSKLSQEVEDIFASLKNKKRSQPPSKPASTVGIDTPTEGNAEPADDLGFGSSTTRGRKRTEEGFFVYTTDELKIGQGGDTPLCPFDCECCY